MVKLKVQKTTSARRPPIFTFDFLIYVPVGVSIQMLGELPCFLLFRCRVHLPAPVFAGEEDEALGYFVHHPEDASIMAKKISFIYISGSHSMTTIRTR